MELTLYQSPSVFEHLAAEWDSLADNHRSDNMFMLKFWQQTWWKYLHRGELAVLSVRDDDGVLRGIAPFFIEEESGECTLFLIGSADVTDYLEIPAAKGYETSVLTVVLQYLCFSEKAPVWDKIKLCNIPESSPTYTHIPKIAKGLHLNITITETDVCPVISLPETYEDYLASLDKKQRHELRRKRRRAEEFDVQWYVVSDEHDLDEQIEIFLELMAKSTDEKAEFLEVPGHREFFYDLGHAAYEQGLLDLLFLTIEGKHAAAMWQFAINGRALLYNSGLYTEEFKALSPGIVLLTYSIEHAISQGLSCYDFLRGDEVYKYRMGARDTHIYDIPITRES